ncbi:MAG TPA: hypothetical protein VL463_30000 [Kofleriaceae bacterium]|nr:hypothetical protein [Kofleriaceae bacterium]
MATTDPTPTADDQYERFFAEKLWELVPSLHKHEDGIAERPGTLRAFIELVAEQAALLRRSHDRLWDDAFIDLCDDWAVPYIGDLVATRMVSALNKRGRRVDVAKTIYYRRRKGTPRVLEELIADITGWEGKVVESFRFLARCAHRLDPPIAERVDPSPGWADLRSPRLGEMAGGPWDPFAHTPDVRRSRGVDGRWNIPKITFHLFRLAAIPLREVTPFARAGGKTFTFDPSGRDVQVFMPRLRDERFAWDRWQSALPWQVPGPMGCRVLGHAEYVIDETLGPALLAAGVTPGAVGELAPVVGERFPTEAALHEWLATIVDAGHRTELLQPANYDRIRAGALIDDCGKAALWTDAIAVYPTGGLPVRRERMSAAGLDPWTPPDPDHDLLVDPVRGRFSLASAPPIATAVRVDYVAGFGGGLGAGGTDRRKGLIDAPDVTVPAAPPGGGTIDAAIFPVDPITTNVVGSVEVPDSATYGVTGDPSEIERLVIQAANFERPYVRISDDWIFTAAAGVGATLVIDGLWIGARPAAALIVRGAWTEIVLRHVTLDPGGTDTDGATLPPVALWIEGSVDHLVIDQSIAASIGTRSGGEIAELTVTDSILDAQRTGADAIALTPGDVEMRRTTVLGAITVDRLDASEVLVTGHVEVTDTQDGCFRFSSAPAGSRLPHPYRAVEWSGGPVFASTRFGDAGYTWLADSAPEELRRGGEGGVEIGAWSSALNAIKEDSLLRKVEEYLPFGLMPMFIRET